MKSTIFLRTSTVLLIALVAFTIIGLFSRQVVSLNSRVFSNEPRQPRLYHQLNDPEYDFINSLRLAALVPSSSNQKHPNQIVSSPSRKQQVQLFPSGGPNANNYNDKDNNEPDVAELLQQNAARQARLQRSLNNNNEKDLTLSSTKNQLQMYQDEQLFKRQLPVSIISSLAKTKLLLLFSKVFLLIDVSTTKSRLTNNLLIFYL